MCFSNVTIATACRDSSHLVGQFRRQSEALEWPAERLRVAVCEGDSADDTWAQLMRWYVERPGLIRLVRRDTGAQKWPSIVDAERFRQLAQVFNAALDLVDLEWSDYVLFVPFDVVFEPDLLRRLVGHGVDLVSPLTWRDGLFYDTWALVQFGGETWPNFDREWARRHLGSRLIEMDLVGGTMLMTADVLRAGCRYTEDEVDRGLARCARAKGFRCWVDAGLSVIHPGEREYA